MIREATCKRFFMWTWWEWRLRRVSLEPKTHFGYSSFSEDFLRGSRGSRKRIIVENEWKQSFIDGDAETHSEYFMCRKRCVLKGTYSCRHVTGLMLADESIFCQFCKWYLWHSAIFLVVALFRSAAHVFASYLSRWYYRIRVNGIVCFVGVDSSGRCLSHSFNRIILFSIPISSHLAVCDYAIDFRYVFRL